MKAPMKLSTHHSRSTAEGSVRREIAGTWSPPHHATTATAFQRPRRASQDSDRRRDTGHLHDSRAAASHARYAVSARHRRLLARARHRRLPSPRATAACSPACSPERAAAACRLRAPPPPARPPTRPPARRNAPPCSPDLPSARSGASTTACSLHQPACSLNRRPLAARPPASSTAARSQCARLLSACPPARPAPARSTGACSSAGVPVCSAASPPPGAQPPHIPSSPFRPARYSPGPAPPVTVVTSVWVYHGEDFPRENLLEANNTDDVEYDRMDEMLEDLREDPDLVFPQNHEEPPPPEVKKFFDLLKAAEEPLHEHTTVSVLAFFICWMELPWNSDMSNMW
eukprot:XP_020393555.1 atherin-like [Zea mays]